MTRPKVPDDKRQRTAQACDICKRRKQKCNGKRPCATCIKRNLSCAYTPPTPVISHNRFGVDRRSSPTKRPLAQDVLSPDAARVPARVSGRGVTSTPVLPFSTNINGLPGVSTIGHNEPPNFLPPYRSLSTSVIKIEQQSRQTTASEPDEESEVVGQMRMLLDPRGRLLYVGDSATLSYLQLIRMIVDHVSGPSPFTSDPSRFKIIEAAISLPLQTTAPQIVPDRETASVLIEAYFTNTQGLLDILDRRKFEQFFDSFYTNQLMTDSPNLCLLYMTLAIGLVMATPAPRSREEEIVTALRSEPLDKAESFFGAARSFVDPFHGLEDGDLWSVQALSLMSVYMLAVSKRNAAYAYYGMAVRTAFALGLHRIREVPIVFPEEQVVLRRNIWRSLFILDRFLSASLGRPTAISEEDCADDSLEAPPMVSQNGYSTLQDKVSVKALDAGVKACQSIGQILKRVYSRRQISTKIAHEIAVDCEKYARIPRLELDAKELFDGSTVPNHGMSILYVHLFNFHSIILLYRPFFLYLLISTIKAKFNQPRDGRRPNSRLERFAEACVTASTRTLVLVRVVHKAGYLPRRNPFILYFLFAATLIMLSNEFANLYRNDQYNSLMASTLEVFSYCARSDVQAKRLLFIVESFHSVVQQTPHKTLSDETQAVPVVLSDRDLAESLGILDPETNGSHDLHVITGMYDEISYRKPSTVWDANHNPYSKSYPMVQIPKSEATLGLKSYPPRTSSTASSRSSFTGQNTDPDQNDSVGGEHEFAFDTFWDLNPAARPNSQNQALDLRPAEAAMTQTTPIAIGAPVFANGYGCSVPSAGQAHEQGIDATAATEVPK